MRITSQYSPSSYYNYNKNTDNQSNVSFKKMNLSSGTKRGLTLIIPTFAFCSSLCLVLGFLKQVTGKGNIAQEKLDSIELVHQQKELEILAIKNKEKEAELINKIAAVKAEQAGLDSMEQVLSEEIKATLEKNAKVDSLKNTITLAEAQKQINVLKNKAAQQDSLLKLANEKINNLTVEKNTLKEIVSSKADTKNVSENNNGTVVSENKKTSATNTPEIKNQTANGNNLKNKTITATTYAATGYTITKLLPKNSKTSQKKSNTASQTKKSANTSKPKIRVIPNYNVLRSTSR